MKQRDLLFAGLFLLGAPAFAQQVIPEFPELRFDDKKDAKVIFSQDFEDDWETWSTEVVDKIDGVWYYDVDSLTKTGNFNATQIWKDSIWNKKIFREDTIIDLKNGVLVTDNAGEIAANNFPGETFTIATDDTPERHDAFRNFGEADEGGTNVFKYTSDTCTLEAVSWGTYKGGYTANYRRNLFVRGIPIDEESSYRLTFYLKTKSLPGHDAAPRMSAGVFRGYFASEKPFSNGLENDADNYKYNIPIEYEKTDFAPSDRWEKVTYMTYYLNDSIANNFVFVDGYWWADEWRWHQTLSVDGKDTTIVRDYHVQPDKFFVRLGFVSDYTEFQIDNLSLTKSWIGGAEYYGDKLRVDFGYKTNLAELAKAAKARTNIAAAEIIAEVPGEKVEELGYRFRFEVFGLTQGGDPTNVDDYEEVPIRSAEFHDDGYMYMFTEFYDEENAYQFDDYDRVLVTFHNPIDDPDLTLKYTGDGKSVAELFPKALDTTWIKNGKIVPDFYNEIATQNPYVFTGVHSLLDLPPVLQDIEIPDGSIFLDPVQSFSFKFSRDILFDNLAQASEKVIGYVRASGIEYVWTPSFDYETNTLTITCPDDSWQNLKGDVEVALIQLYGKGTDAGENVTVHYNFGSYSRETEDYELTPIDISWTMVGEHTSVAKGVYTWSASNKTIGQGTAIGTGNLNRMFTHEVEGSALLRGYEVRPHGAGNGGHVYLGAGDPTYKITLAAGGYKFKFKGTGWSWNGAAIQPATVYVFPRENDPTSVSSSAKTEIGVYNATVASDDGDLQNKDYAIPAENVDVVEYEFSVAEGGDYIIEFNNKAGAWSQGVFVGDFELGGIPGNIFYVNSLNNAVAAAQERVELAEVDENYEGVILDALNSMIGYYKEGGAFDDLKSTEPADWTAAVKELNDATEAMKLRMDTVDAFTAKVEEVMGKLADNDAFSVLPVYETLNDLYEAALVYPVTEKLGSDIYAFNTEMDDAIKALDARIALNNSYDAALSAAKNFVESEDAKTQYDEFSVLEQCYTFYSEEFDEYSVTDTEITDATDAIIAATNPYKKIVQGASILPTRVKALYELAKELGSDIVDNEEVNAQLAITDFDDDYLADVYKTAIKIALYEAADVNLDDPKLDSIDVTPFIKNYHLYATPTIVERMDKQMPANAGDLSAEDPDGAQIQHTRHQYNDNGNMPIWILILDKEFDDLYPGWTVKSIGSYGGNRMVTTGNEVYTSYSQGQLVFDGVIGMDWNSAAEMKTELVDLPVGQYTLGVNLIKLTANEGEGKIASLTVNTTDNTYSNKAVASGTNIPLAVDSILVGENDNKVSVDFLLRSQNGWSVADNFFLSFRPVDGFDYAGAIDDLETELAGLLTVVDARQAVKAGVEYFTIGGIKLDAPKAGQILIRKTTQSNGKVVMDKVLIK